MKYTPYSKYLFIIIFILKFEISKSLFWARFLQDQRWRIFIWESNMPQPSIIRVNPSVNYEPYFLIINVAIVPEVTGITV